MWRQYWLACLICFGALPTAGYYFCLIAWGSQHKKEVLNTLPETPNSQLIVETLKSMLKDFELTEKSIHVDTIPKYQLTVFKIDISFTAIYDNDVYRFLHQLFGRFPETVTAKTLKLKRTSLGKQIEKAPLSDHVAGYLQLYWIQPPLVQ
ncbi:MAG: hypothetical protein ABFQ95_00335 [Pseudomonadota bacterium]